MNRVMVGKFSGINKFDFEEPLVFQFISKEDISQLKSHGHEIIEPAITNKNVYDVFREHGLSNGKVVEFLKEMVTESFTNNGFRTGFILSYKDVTGFVPIDMYFKDVAYEKFYVECIGKYFKEVNN